VGPGSKHPDTVVKGKGKLGLIRNPCLSEPGFQERLVESQKSRSPYEDAGALCRSYGDEVNSIGVWDGCFSPACQETFRVWLRDQYGTLDALNKEWETSFRDWTDVVAMTHEEVQGRHSFAPWADHRTFNEWNWARSFAAVRRGTETADPGMRILISGTQETSAFNAYDWRRLMEALTALAAYAGEQTVMQRSFGKDFLWMPWIGYSVAADQLESILLNYLFAGATGFNVFSGRSYLNPDFTFPTAAENLRGALGRFGQGRAEAIMHSTYESSPIALHYSPASIHVNWMLDETATRKSVIEGIRSALNQFGCTYDYLAYDQLASGEAGKRGYRILVLPMSTALSPAEAEGVRQFVKAGGVVLADMLPGVYSDHGRLQERPSLDDVFGVSQAGVAVRKEDAVLEAMGKAESIDSSGFSIPVQRFTAGLRLESGKPLAQIKTQERNEPAWRRRGYPAWVRPVRHVRRLGRNALHSSASAFGAGRRTLHP
jgi:hypothetical protein